MWDQIRELHACHRDVLDHRRFWDAMHAVSLAALEGHSSPAARDGRVSNPAQ
jgi:hypothetical protein